MYNYSKYVFILYALWIITGKVFLFHIRLAEVFLILATKMEMWNELLNKLLSTVFIVSFVSFVNLRNSKIDIHLLRDFLQIMSEF